jgi:hypothetical protein
MSRCHARIPAVLCCSRYLKRDASFVIIIIVRLADGLQLYTSKNVNNFGQSQKYSYIYVVLDFILVQIEIMALVIAQNTNS